MIISKIPLIHTIGPEQAINDQQTPERDSIVFWKVVKLIRFPQHGYAKSQVYHSNNKTDVPHHSLTKDPPYF